MATLFDYLKSVQRLLRDAKQDMLNPEDLIGYINVARREVAMRAQCIRITPPVSGSVVSWTITNGGSGYSNNPTLAITPPDFPSGQLPSPNGAQAIAAAIVQNGIITAIDSTFGGYGYFQPQMTITDVTGKNATAVAVMSPMNLLRLGQERYDFSNIDLSAFPGVSEIYNVRSVNVIYQNYRYSLGYQPWTVYQGYVRQYPFQYQYVPTFYSQFGQGASGSLFCYPLPSQTYQWEWDCLCLPSDLIDNQSYDVLPDPWTDAVKYFATALAFEEIQNLNTANYHHQQFEKRLLNYSNYARIGKMPNVYGRP
jgi:hypothetical protein